MSNIEQGMSSGEGPVNPFDIRNSLFDIHHSKSPFLPFALSPFLPSHLVVIALCWIGLATNAGAQQVVPPLTGRVVDLAGILSPSAEETLTALLAAHEDSTTNQVAVLTIPSLEGETIEAFSFRVAETWALGAAEKDNGVLLVVAVEDRKLRIEVGFGLEGDLPDVIASRIIREEIVPYFREGNNEQGVVVGVLAVLAHLENQAEPVEAAGQVETETAAEPSNAFWFDWWEMILAVYFLASLVLCCVAAALAMLEKTPGRELIFVFLLPCFFLISRSLGYFIFWFMPVLLFAVGVAGLYAVLFWRLALRLKSDSAFKVSWQHRLLIHGPDRETPAEEDTATKEEAAADAHASPYPRRIQKVVLIAFTTQLALFLYTRWLSVTWLIVGAVLAWFCLTRIAEDPAQRKRRRTTTWTPFGSMPSSSSRSSSRRSSRSSRRSYTSSSWSSRSSSSYSSSSYSSSSSSSSGSFSGGGGSFGGGGASGSW